MELSSQHRSISGYLIKNRGSNGSSKKIIPNIPPLSFRLFDGIPVGDINVLFPLFSNWDAFGDISRSADLFLRGIMPGACQDFICLHL